LPVTSDTSRGWNAIIEAAPVTVALAAIEQGARITPVAAVADEPDNVPVRTVFAVAIERNPLVRVARAFRRSPIVGAVLGGVAPLPAFVVENAG